MAADKSLLYLSQARIYSALALKNIQASLMFLARLCYIFGGSEIYRLPYIHLLQNNSVPMDRNKNSIQMGYQCKNPFVCCLFIFFYIFVSRSFPLPSAFLSTDIERGKVFGLNTLRRRKIQSETACRLDLSTFKGYCTTFADEQRKGANDGIGKLIISQIYDRPNSNTTLH